MTANSKNKTSNHYQKIIYVFVYLLIAISLSGCIAMMPLMVIPPSKYKEKFYSDKALIEKLRNLNQKGTNDVVRYLKAGSYMRIEKISLEGISISKEEYKDLLIGELKSKPHVKIVSDNQILVNPIYPDLKSHLPHTIVSNKTLDVIVKRRGMVIELEMFLYEDQDGIMEWSNKYSDRLYSNFFTTSR